MVNIFSNALIKLQSLFLNNSVANSLDGCANCGTSILYTLLDIPIMIWELIVQIAYFICQFMLLLIDFMFIFIRQFIGINADFSDLSSIENSDILLKFITSNAVTGTLKGIFALSLVLIILFAIFAIVKNEYLAATTGSPNAKRQVLVSTLKSLFMIILIPILFIGSIILSNALLKTLDNVTTGGTSISMGNQVFMASTYQANCYRRYAFDNKRIPITYNFEEVNQEGFFDHATEGSVKELEEAFEAFSKKSGWDRGFTTYVMFLNNSFVSLEDVELADDVALESGATEGSGYHSVYDRGLFTKRNEYYSMAEVIDWSVRNNKKFYFKTPQDIWKSWGNNPTPEIRALFKDIASDHISFEVNYANDDKPTLYTSKTSSNNVQDEANGSVFVVCTQESFSDGSGGTVSRLVPLVDGSNFSSSYTVGKNLVVARGFFDEGGYPTAIREDGSEIGCYRDKLNMPYIADLLPKISYEKPEGGTTEVMGWLSGGFKLITGIDIHEFIPYVYFNFDILRLFSKSYRIVTGSDDGSFSINYMFSDKNLAFYNVFNFKDVNVLILVTASSLLIGLIFKMLFGAIARVFDLALLYVTYPAVCATISMDNGSRFATWVKEVINSMLSIYGVVIGINLVMMIYPIVDKIQIFNESDFQNLVASNVIPAGWTANFVNFLVNLIMILASFSLFKTAIDVISTVVIKGYKAKDDNLLDRGDRVVKESKELLTKTKNVLTGKSLLDTGKKVIDTAVGFVPGSAIINAGVQRAKFKKGQSEMANSRNDLAAGVKSGDEKQVAALTKRTEQTTAKYGPKDK